MRSWTPGVLWRGDAALFFSAGGRRTPPRASQVQHLHPLRVVALAGPVVNVVIAIMIVFVPRSTRVLRSVTLGLKSLEFVEAAKVRGESAFWVITRELLPNALGPIVVELAIRLSFAILLSTSLGFIGIGVQPPEPSLGAMIGEGRNYMLTDSWLMTIPGVTIALLVIGMNLIGDGLRDIFDPRLKDE